MQIRTPIRVRKAVRTVRDWNQLSAWQRLVRVIRSDWFFILSGIAVGSACIWAQHNLDSLHKDHITTGLIVEHLGMGLIVSSIAVFGYEWRSNAKRALELSENLEIAIEAVEEIMATTRLSEELTRILKDKGGAALEAVLYAMFGRENAPLRKDLKDLIENIYDIQHKKTWLNKMYVDFIHKELLQKFVLKNTRELKKANEGGEGDFHVHPTSGVTADEFLAKHMSLTEPGDSYDVISDISSWRDNQLNKFSGRSVDAIKAGVSIRRVFNLYLVDLPTPDDPTYRDALGKTIRTLRVHLRYKIDLAGERGKYEVRILGVKEIESLMKHTNHHLTDIQIAHYGILKKKGTPQKIIRLKVVLANLSEMKVSCDSEEIERDMRMFDDVWYAASDLTEAKLQEIERQFKLDTTN